MTNYINEFISVVDNLLSKEDAIKKNTKGKTYLLVEKEKILKVLSKYAYDTVLNKLRIWRSLNWIQTDENRFTRKVVVSKGAERKRYVKIDLTVHKVLKEYSQK